jgi:rhodanese-related sulfurtransferase
MKAVILAAVLGAVGASPGPGVRQGEGVVAVAAGHPLLLQERTGRQLVSPVPGAEVSGVSGLRDLAPGDRVRYSWKAERGGVRLAERLDVDPMLAVDPEMAVLPGKLEQELANGATVALDARPHERWEAGHLPGAISAPAGSPDSFLAQVLRTRKALAVYGESGRTREAHGLARRILALGRKDVQILLGGFRQWDVEGLAVLADAQAVARDLAAGRPLAVIDVRPAAVSAAAPLGGTLSIPLDDMRPGEFSDVRQMPPILLVGDGEGDASALAAAERIRRWRAAPEFPRWSLRVLGGGANAWRRARLGTEVRATRGPLRWNPPAMQDAIRLDEFLAIWAEKGAGRVVLDVRSPPVTPAPWVRFVPLEELPSRLGELPRDREIIVYCSAGMRSAVAREILSRNGFRAKYLAALLPSSLP